MNTQAFNIVLPIDLVKKIDSAAAREYKNRSELIREALRLYLKEEAQWDAIFAYGKNQAQKASAESEKDVDTIVRNYRKGS